MKTSHTLLSFAASAVLAIALLNIELAAVALFAAAILGFAFYDYTRAFHAGVPAPTARGAVKRFRHRLGLIA